jgi:hypothetical protein
MNEMHAAKLHVAARLQASFPGTVVLPDQVPDNVRDGLMYKPQSARDEVVVGEHRLGSEVLIQVFAVDIDDRTRLAANARLLDIALHKSTGEYDGWRVMQCVREQPQEFSHKLGNGQVRFYQGGTYRVFVKGPDV